MEADRLILRGNVWENQRGQNISGYNVYLKFAWWIQYGRQNMICREPW